MYSGSILPFKDTSKSKQRLPLIGGGGGGGYYNVLYMKRRVWIGRDILNV